MIKQLFFMTVMLWGGMVQAQSHLGVFPTIDHSGIISGRFSYSLYYFGAVNLINEEVKGYREPANLFAFYSEQALTYSANPHLSLTGSYVYERQRPFATTFRNENRFYVQAAYKYDLNRTSVKHRLRYDGRFIEDRVTGDAPFTSRIRYQFGITTPLMKTSDKVYFNAYNEFFFNLGKASVAFYGENWAYAGVGWKVPGAGSFELGPLYIFWVNDKQNNLSNFYYLQLTWLTQLDLRRKN